MLLLCLIKRGVRVYPGSLRMGSVGVQSNQIVIWLNRQNGVRLPPAPGSGSPPIRDSRTLPYAPHLSLCRWPYTMYPTQAFLAPIVSANFLRQIIIELMMIVIREESPECSSSRITRQPETEIIWCATSPQTKGGKPKPELLCFSAGKWPNCGN